MFTKFSNFLLASYIMNFVSNFPNVFTLSATGYCIKLSSFLSKTTDFEASGSLSYLFSREELAEIVTMLDRYKAHLYQVFVD